MSRKLIPIRRYELSKDAAYGHAARNPLANGASHTMGSETGSHDIPLLNAGTADNPNAS
jgi:hypothetical protein